MFEIIWPYVAATIAAFISTTLRGFQNKNVAGDHRKAAFFTGYLMAAADAAIIGLVVKAGVWVVLVSGFGAGAGYIMSMYLHRLLLKKQHEQARQRERDELKRLIDKRIQKKRNSVNSDATHI